MRHLLARPVVGVLLLLVTSLVACDTTPRASHCEGIPEFDIWVTDLEGTLSRLTDSPGADGLARWSPDGQRIAFVASRDGNCEVYVMHADGTWQTNLTNSDADDMYPTWSPDGSEIAFTRDGQLWVMELESGIARQLTTGSMHHNYPDWSPDGKELVFAGGSDAPGPGVVHEVYVVSSEGGEPRVLTDMDELLVSPRWSPDGSHIAFFSHRDPFTLWVMDADGAEVNELAQGGFVSWSPDGLQVVFDREIAETEVDLFVKELAGSERPLLVDPGLQTTPDWSPDGSLVLYSSDRP